MDAADRAQDVEEMERTAALARRPRLEGPGLPSCEQCGEEIPAARRAAVGARLCVGCQTDLERMLRR